MNRLSLRRLLVVLTVLALLGTACSSDSSDTSAPDSGSEESEGGASGAEGEVSPTPTSAADDEAGEDEEEAAEDGEGAVSPTPTGEPTPEEAEPVSVELPDYPLFENDVMTADQELLDELAAAYLAANDGDSAEIERFLFGGLPVEVFNRIFAGEAGDDVASLLWLMHLSGYFGGRWLRGEIAAAQPEAPLVGFSQEPTEESFGETMDAAQLVLDAADGTDEAVLEYAASSLPNQPPTEEGGEEQGGLTDNFGYNQGYMLQILEAPPEGVEANPQYQIECTAGLFDCQYATARFAVLTELAETQAAIAASDPPYADLVAQLLPIQEAAIPRGRGVWSGGLSVQGFSQESYDQLLDVSSSFLETIQATAITMAQATAEDDADQARLGALANAAIVVWLDAYIAGLTNGEGEIELPAFA